MSADALNFASFEKFKSEVALRTKRTRSFTPPCAPPHVQLGSLQAYIYNQDMSVHVSLSARGRTCTCTARPRCLLMPVAAPRAGALLGQMGDRGDRNNG